MKTARASSGQRGGGRRYFDFLSSKNAGFYAFFIAKKYLQPEIGTAGGLIHSLGA